MKIYLDNAATTPVRPEVKDAMMPWLMNEYGNPSSHYELGHTAADAIWSARKTIASMINAEPEEIFFTSGGSESNTWAINGLYNINECGPFVTSAIEHHSILNNRKKKKIVHVDENGSIYLDSLREAISYNTPLVAVMMVNNEIGTIEPIKEVDKICYEADTFLHVDAVQAFGHIPIDVKQYLGVSTLSASGHKIGAPKGVGFLYIQKDVQKLYNPLIYGGQQEFGMRGGTENVASIVGFAKTCELAKNEIDIVQNRNRSYLCAMWHDLREAFDDEVWINGHEIWSPNRIGNNLNILFHGVRAEELMELLNFNGVYVSSGSACNSDSNEPSHVLKELGLSDDDANASIRISLGYQTTGEEIAIATKNIINNVELLLNR